jgi:heme A synthase
MQGLFFAYYNFCRKHETIKKTQRMLAGLLIGSGAFWSCWSGWPNRPKGAYMNQLGSVFAIVVLAFLGLGIGRVPPSRNVWLNLAFAAAFIVFISAFHATWNYFEGTPIHFLRFLAIYSIAGAVVFFTRQFQNQERAQQHK